MDSEVLAHRDESAAPLEVIQARDAPLCVVIHPVTSELRGPLASSIVAAGRTEFAREPKIRAHHPAGTMCVQIQRVGWDDPD
jgi:hypothetical protein